MAQLKASQQVQIQALLKDTIVLLCRNGLSFQTELNVEALVGITVDQNEIILVSIKELIQPENVKGSSFTSMSTIPAKNNDINETCVDQQWPEVINSSPDAKECSIDPDKTASNGHSSNLRSAQYHAEVGRNMKRCSPLSLENVSKRKLEYTGFHASEYSKINPVSDRSHATYPAVDRKEDREKLQQSTVAYTLSPPTLQPFTDIRERNISSHKDPHTNPPLSLTRKHEWKTGQLLPRQTELPGSLHPVVASVFGECAFQPLDNSTDSDYTICVKEEILDDADSSEVFLVASDPHELTDSSGCESERCLTSEGSVASSKATPGTKLQSSNSSVENICHSILTYHGWCVPPRDIRRHQLRNFPSAMIRHAMERLDNDNLGRLHEIAGKMYVFYKCPPPTVDQQTLAKYGVSWHVYSSCYAAVPTPNLTNQHNERYWNKVLLGSPYMS